MAMQASNSTDYYISIRGSNNIGRENSVLRSENNSHGGHGISIKGI